MEPPVIATASAGIVIFSLIRNWLWGRAMSWRTFERGWKNLDFESRKGNPPKTR
jgi:hypothetical protein